MTHVLDKADPTRILNHLDEMGLGGGLLASSLAVHPRAVQRWKDGSALPNEASWRALEKLEAIYQLAVRLLREDTLASWFHAANETLGGERPAALLGRGELDRVRNALGMLEWGIYS